MPGYTINWNGKQLQDLVAKRVGGALRRTGMEMVRNVQASMRQTERHPERRGAKGPVSMPGHPPAPQHGLLVSSIAMDDSELESKGVVHVGATGEAPYAIYLELGASQVRGGKTITLAPRPFLRPALDRAWPPLKEQLKGLIK